MGTRSLLAVETKPGKYHVQYMQFDGNPNIKGQEYYGAILESLQECPSAYVRKHGKEPDWTMPGKAFFTRIMHFLNNYQYQTGHSIGHHWPCLAADWEKQNAGQEWQYLFDKDGNFTFFPNDHEYSCTIPWELTINLAQTIKRDFSHPDILASFWDAMDKWEGKTLPLKLSLDIGEAYAFPDQGSSNGWREYGILKHGSKEIRKSMFSETKYKRRNEKSLRVQFKSEYLSVMTSPKENLPLHVGIQNSDAQKLLTKRLQTV